MLALQVLLIHLIELSKVDELCKDFCSRYITTLKQQQETEKLARLESEEGLQLSEASPPAADPNANVSEAEPIRNLVYVGKSFPSKTFNKLRLSMERKESLDNDIPGRSLLLFNLIL